MVVQSLSHVWLFETPWITVLQASLSYSISWSLLKHMSIELVMPSNHLILCHPLSSCLQPFPASVSFPKSQFFTSGSQSIGASVSVLPMNIQGWSPLGLTGLISCSPRDSPELGSISSSVFSFLYGPTLTSTHDYWKNHSFDSMDLCRQSDVSAF